MSANNSSSFLVAPLVLIDLPDGYDLQHVPGLRPRLRALSGESITLLKLGWPMVLEEVGSYLSVSLCMVAISYDAQVFAAVSLARSITNITGVAYIIGITGPIDTYVSQAYGARNFSLIGTILQHAIVVSVLLCLPVLATWLWSSPYIGRVTKDVYLAENAAIWIKLFSPWILLHAAAVCLIRGLIAQGAMTDVLGATIVLLIATPPMNWLFIHKLNLGIEGSAMATVAIEVLYLTGIAIITWVHNRRQGPAAPFQRGRNLDFMHGLGSYLKLAAACTAMVLLDFAQYDLSTIIAGSLPSPEIALAAMAIAVQLSTLIFMVPYGLAFAISSRVGNLLGAHLPRSAHLAAQAGICLSLGLTALATLPVLLLSRQVTAVFTAQHDIINLCHKIVWPLGIVMMGNAAAAACTGVLRATGQQRNAALLNCVANWVIGLPLELFLAFYFKMGVVGLWWGLAAAGLLQAVLLAVLVTTCNWENETMRANKSLNKLCEHLNGHPQGMHRDSSSVYIITAEGNGAALDERPAPASTQQQLHSADLPKSTTPTQQTTMPT